jgi:hypothetical protein
LSSVAVSCGLLSAVVAVFDGVDLAVLDAVAGRAAQDVVLVSAPSR